MIISGLLHDHLPPLPTATAIHHRPREGRERRTIPQNILVSRSGSSVFLWNYFVDLFSIYFFKLLFTHRRLINDSLRTDVSILFPPYCIALAAIYMTAVYLKVDAKDWFAELNVDMDVVSLMSYPKIHLSIHVS